MIMHSSNKMTSCGRANTDPLPKLTCENNVKHSGTHTEIKFQLAYICVKDITPVFKVKGFM